MNWEVVFHSWSSMRWPVASHLARRQSCWTENRNWMSWKAQFHYMSIFQCWFPLTLALTRTWLLSPSGRWSTGIFKSGWCSWPRTKLSRATRPWVTSLLERGMRISQTWLIISSHCKKCVLQKFRHQKPNEFLQMNSMQKPKILPDTNHQCDTGPPFQISMMHWWSTQIFWGHYRTLRIPCYAIQLASLL